MSKIDDAALAEPTTELVGVVHELREEIEVLHNAVDELREQVQFAMRNVLGHEHGRTAVTSMPRDPCAADFGARLNEMPNEQVDIIRRETSAKTRTAPEQDSTGVDPDTNDEAPPTLSMTARETATAEVIPPNVNRSMQTTPNAAPERSAAKRQPLSLRIYFQPVMTEIVRAVAYETLTRDEALLRLEMLTARYNQAAVEEAARELIVRAEGNDDHWRLSSEARRLSRGLLGPPPEAAGETAAAVSTMVTTASPQAEDGADKQPPTSVEEVKAPRKEVLARLREHLAATDEDPSEVPADDLERFRERGWMLPDLMIADEFVAVRRKLSAAQRHDMQQWLEVSEYGAQATRAWARQTTSGWGWIYEVVASKHTD